MPASMWFSIKGIPYQDASGWTLRNFNGSVMMWPSDVNPNYFAAAARYYANYGDPLEQLYHFWTGNDWDIQRVDGINIVRPFMNAANVSIGIYGAAAGIPEDYLLGINNSEAAWHSYSEPMDSVYTSTPARNVYNIKLGYQLYEGGLIK